MTKAALEGLGLAFGVTESLIVEVESEVVDSLESRGPESLATSHMPKAVHESKSWRVICPIHSWQRLERFELTDLIFFRFRVSKSQVTCIEL